MPILTSDNRHQQWLDIKTTLQQDRLLYAYVFVTTLALYLMSQSVTLESKIEYDAFTYLETLISICYVTFLSWSTGYYLYLAYHKTPHPLVVYIKTLLGFFNPLSKAVSFILLVLALNLTFSCYTYLKSIIPDIKPFQYDLLFYHLDNWLHFGTDPWQLTHQWFSSIYSTFVINFLYNLWFLLMWGSVLFFIVRRDIARLRNQYLVTFMASWLFIGGISATLLSSAGPCYSHLVDSELNHYLPLMDRLMQQSISLETKGLPPLWALDVQDMLWLKYLGRESGVGSGISAMPSMHVSIAVLMALGAYQLNRKLGYLMWLYVVAIQIGSVHLAWHYAIDGYLSIVLTLILWKLCGVLARKVQVTN
ncbi:membrane-associated phospholipid phosphatase [Vibrio sinaloensis DSM 21326]|uniref:Membrane-associated phospholipid phosphatase n=1 Tax=Vibrio sinaloensis DSM 21326 TaxID=945550 RepID=E8MD29_PHOS4|nr:phosphatase PAP2 family protein [Vibrio sinaloensis]EGA68205.1 membrane-associated phospholipid phosphatase [Vibrio sinaloensis DSM 21326]